MSVCPALSQVLPLGWKRVKLEVGVGVQDM